MLEHTALLQRHLLRLFDDNENPHNEFLRGESCGLVRETMSDTQQQQQQQSEQPYEPKGVFVTNISSAAGECVVTTAL
jgi:hypothetical protein